MGGGAAVGIVGGVLELAARSKYKKFDEQVAACNMMSSTGNLGCDPATYASLKKTGDTEKTLGYVGYGVAGVAIAAGVGLAWANRRQPYQIHAEELQNEKEDKDDAVSIVPVIAPTMTGAMVMGHF
jgi:hypothetical protein